MAIRMEPSQIRDLATFLTDTKGQIEDLVSRMDSRINADTEAWDGVSKTTYFEGYENIKPTLTTTFPQVIQSLQQQLNYAANEIEAADQNIAKGFKG